MSVMKDKTLMTRQYMEGVEIFKPGDDADEAFLIDKGAVGIFKTVDGEDVEIAVLSEGEIFGEMAILQNTTHTSKAMAKEKTNLVIINQSSLKDKVKEADPLMGGRQW